MSSKPANPPDSFTEEELDAAMKYRKLRAALAALHPRLKEEVSRHGLH